MDKILDFLKNIDKGSVIAIGIIILIMILFYIKKSSKYVKDIVSNAVIEAEKHFNSGEGQKKLEFAVENIKLKLPFLLRIFITKSVLVTLIEYTLNKLADTFETNIKVDIKGNERVIEKIDLGVTNNTIEISTGKKDNINIDSGDKAEVYASLKAKTDWRDKPETSIEVGIKKKI